MRVPADGQPIAVQHSEVVAPGVLVTATFTFILSWTEYLFASVFIIDDILKTLPVEIQRKVFRSGKQEIILRAITLTGEIMKLGVLEVKKPKS